MRQKSDVKIEKSEEQLAVETRSKQPPKPIESERDKRLRQAIGRVCKNKDGLDILRDLMMECGYQTPSVVADPASGEIFIDSTVYNEARRNLWLRYRRFIPREQLVLIEIGGSE